MKKKKLLHIRKTANRMSLKCTECDKDVIPHLGGTTCMEHTPFEEYKRRSDLASRVRKELTRKCDISQCFLCSEKGIDKWGSYNRLYYPLEKLNGRQPGTNIRCIKLNSRKDFLCHQCIPDDKRNEYYPAMPFFGDFHWYSKDYEEEEDREYWQSKKQ